MLLIRETGISSWTDCADYTPEFGETGRRSPSSIETFNELLAQLGPLEMRAVLYFTTAEATR